MITLLYAGALSILALFLGIKTGQKRFSKDENIQIINDDFRNLNFLNLDADCFFLNEPLKNRKDFELVYENWEGYISGRISRSDLCESRFTKYTISIIHQFLKD